MHCHFAYGSTSVTSLEVPAEQSSTAVPHWPFSGVLPMQDCVSIEGGSSSAGQAVLLHSQLTVRVRV